MKSVFGIIIVIVIVGVATVASSAYIVNETEQVIITRFGKPVGEAVTEAGLHWKSPFIEDVHRFEKRVLPFDGDPNQIVTKDKKYIFIDTFARWKIVDPLKFFISVHNEIGAQTRLDDILDSATRVAISDNNLIEAVRNTNRKLVIESVGSEEAQSGVTTEESYSPLVSPVDNLPPVEKGRAQITRDIFEAARGKVGEYGIELVDVEIKRINYVEEVRRQVYERMISERQQIAEKHRSEGKEFLLGVQGEIEREQAGILSRAYETAEKIKAEGDALAARTYAEAYNQDPEFYRFWRTMEFYRQNLAENTTLVVSTDSDLFRYLVKGGLPEELTN